jgi:hypothetical protein
MAKSFADKELQKKVLFTGYIELLNMKEAEKLRPLYKTTVLPGLRFIMILPKGEMLF